MENEPYLDLTYGTGGDQSSQYPDDDDDYADAQQEGPTQHGFGSQFDAFAAAAGMGMSDDDDDEVQYEDDDEDMNERDHSGLPHNNIHHDGLFHYDHQIQPGISQSSNNTEASGSPVVEEHTGRWTKEEHEAFLQGLQIYGKEWKKVAAKVRTRTVVQTRTHAQKYFQKLQKSVQDSQQASNRRRNAGNSTMELGDDSPQHDDETQRMIEIMNSVNPDDEDPLQSLASTGSGTRGRSIRGRGGRRSNASSSLGSNSKMIASTKKVVGGQQQHQHQLQPLLPPPPVAAMKGVLKSAYPTATPHQQRRGSTATLNAAQVISTLSSAKTATNPSSMSRPQQQQQSLVTVVGSSHNVLTTPSREQGFFLSNNSSSMKITAPDPSKMGRHYAFPEPSPAATGKRKLAEIAAAQMLAGVISSNSKHHHHQHPNQPVANKLDLSQADGPPTPPISSYSGNDDVHSAISSRPLHLNDAPPLPPLVSNSSTTSNRPTLQIVNPDVFGIFPSSSRNAHGRTSPVTPWDSELNALLASTSVPNADEGDSDEKDLVDIEIMASEVQPPSCGEEHQSREPGSSMLNPIRGPVDGYSRTPLHQAVCAQDEETVKTLIDVIGTQSKDLNQCDSAGYTPLHSACCVAAVVATNLSEEENDDDKPNHIVRMLLKAGCNPFLLDSNGNSPLHWSVRACDYDATQQLLNLVSKVRADAPETENDTAAINNTVSADSEAVREYVNLPNQFGETCLHWAARGGMPCCDPIVPLLLSYSANPSAVNKSSKRPIDVAAEGYIDEPHSLASLRIHASVKSTPSNNGDVKKKSADDKGLADALQRTLPDRMATRRFLLHHSPSLRTLVLHHPECLDHHPKSMSDWETPDRVKTILQRLDIATSATLQSNASNSTSILPHEIVVSQEFDRGNLELLSRVHSKEYLSFVNQLSKELERKVETHVSGVDMDMDGDMIAKTANATTKWGLPISSSSLPVVPFTPMVQRSMIKVAESNVKLSDNSDTSFSVGSLRAARRAAGAVQHAIDCVLTGKSRNSFCVVRPPGHHAGVNGLLEGGESCGFCIFNNVAAGAMHALAEYKDVCQRIAIVDIDVHHGNGTEEIVRKCNDPSTLFFFSIHLFDNDEITTQSKKKNHQLYKFYPGTGCSDDLAMNIINVPILPLWKDVQTKATSTEPKTHNTRKKLRSNAGSTVSQPETNDGDSSEPSTPLIVSSTNSSRHSDGESSTATATQQTQSSSNGMVPMTSSLAGTILTLPGRMAYRQAITSRLLPSLRAFNPNLILISAGFDASSGDVGNARHEKDRERMGMDLSPDDYAWTTRQILQIADICCKGRVVSILEGGYGRTPLSETTAAATSQLDTATAVAATTLDRHIFGECAIRHLHALIDPYDVEQRFG